MLMSAVYAIVMLIVIVGTVVNAFQESITSPNVIFLITLAGFYALGALLHPQEIFCAIPGLLYFLCIPSGYLLLQIYSITNLHVVSWGTREVATKKSAEEIKREKEEEEERQRAEKLKKKGLLSWLGLDSFVNDLKEFYQSMIGRKSTDEDEAPSAIDELKKSIAELNDKVDGKAGGATKSRNELQEILAKKKEQEALGIKEDAATDELEDAKPPKIKRDELRNPRWMEEPALGDGEIRFLESKEITFWKQLIKMHLHPLDKDKKKEAKDAADLVSLRNNIVFGYLMLNFLWIVLIFQLQLLKETLQDDFFVPIPRLDDPQGEPDKFEPLGLAFLSVFASILLIQFSATIVHR